MIAVSVVRKERADVGQCEWRCLILEKMQRYNALGLANDQIWGKGGKVTQSWC